MVLPKRLRTVGSLFGALAIVAFAECGFSTLAQSRLRVTISSTTSSDRLKKMSQTRDPLYVSEPVSCESFATLIDNAAVEWLQQDGTYLIVIVRIGEGERSNLAKSRMNSINKYLEHYKSSRVVTAEGDRMRGLGRIELYVGGKLKTVISVKKNSLTVCVGIVNPFLEAVSFL